ncbi:S41 family peptidase [Carboxydochorda subterranea]|uniref:S41 family peptidase n=1 Tax=Carboxydichorda subterranea TaxID=3109565 RepID=A0ABZ1BZR7_9FIRM|nr:S41 family peptidase [Limnochorda sp. L945t]WRP18001.1 S41 family peptidase [Limnochorda sp. L945t]
MKGPMGKAWPAIVIVTALAVGALVGVSLLSMGAPPSQGASARSGDDLATALEVIGVIKTHYLEPVSTVDMLAAYMRTGTINGMLKESVKDPYTRYMDAEAYKQFQIDTSGHYGGIGIYIGIQDNKLTVVAPIPGTPAAKAGLQAGDWIVEVDGRPTSEMAQEEATTLIRGPKGSTVELTVERKQKRFKVRIAREEIVVPAVSTVQLLPGQIGYVRLLQFSEDAPAEMERALSTLEQKNYRALILDLRNNPGGLLTAAIDVASLFLRDGPVVHVVGRSGERHTIEAGSVRAHPLVPTVVLVNKGSASASEILAGALQDRKVATLVGTKTFGKGLVQTVIPLGRGDALTVTTQKYQTAGGRYIGNEGIEPDVVVKVPEGDQEAPPLASGKVDLNDVQIQKAMEILTRQLAQAGGRAEGG